MNAHHRPPLHPACEALPRPTPEEFAALVADIKAKGLLNPITMLDGAILDGWSRWDACAEIGVEPRTVEYQGDDPVAFVVSQNLVRRHLNESQRAMVGGRLANMKAGGDRPSKTDRNFDRVNLPDGISKERAAELVKVSPKSVSDAKAVLERGTPEEIESVDNGKVAVSNVARQIRSRAPNQTKPTAPSKPRANPVEETAKALKAKTGKWPSSSVLAKAADVAPRSADNALRTLKAVEQTLRDEKFVSLKTVTKELSPLVKELRVLAQTTVAAIPIPHFAVMAHHLETLLGEWASDDPSPKRSWQYRPFTGAKIWKEDEYERSVVQKAKERDQADNA